jgi:hypothetical protein
MTTETTETESLPRRHHTGLDPSINEPFVKPEVVGDFLDLNDATVVRFATAGFLPGYPLRESGKRTHWRFLLSEIKESMLAKKPTKQVHGVLPHDRNRSTEARPRRTEYPAATDALCTLNRIKQTQEARKVNSVSSKTANCIGTHRNEGAQDPKPRNE